MESLRIDNGIPHLLRLKRKETPKRKEENGVRVFKHLTITDRLRIEKWKKEGMRTREIAEKLRVNPSTVYRELKRGSYDRLNGTT